MSYILDALRKADAEREQGRVPGLHSQLGPAPLPAGPEEAATPATTPAWPLMVAAGGLGAVVAAGVLWWALTPSQQEAIPLAEDRGAAPPVAPPMAQAPIQPTSPAPVQAPAPGVVPTAPRVDPVPAPDLALPQAAPPRPTAPPTTPPVTATAAPPAPVAAQPLSAMPEALRRSLPPLVFGGAMHSDNAASRMLVINNNVYREGDEPATGLVLEQILLKSAVFRYQGQRFSVNY